MEEKKQIKISLKACIIGICIIFFIVICGAIYYFNSNKCTEYCGDYQKVSYINEIDYNNSDFENMIDSEEGYIIITDYSVYNEILSNVESCWYSNGTNNNPGGNNPGGGNTTIGSVYSDSERKIVYTVHTTSSWNGAGRF